MSTKRIKIFLKVCLLLLCITIVNANAQNEGSGASVYGENVSYEIGFHAGHVLPNGVDGVTEITTLFGLRGGWRTSKKTFFEIGAMTGSELNATFSNAHVSWRLEQHIETILTNVYIGFDTTVTESSAGEKATAPGLHLGGGGMMLIAEELWFRADMKYNFNPGTSLYIGFGFMLRYGSSGNQN